ncbi:MULTISPECIES: RNA-binding S4 domain-containing protein [Methylotenera]|uniref:RNA-binding S4 domain-containing protein n=1 Tax=Methylotenera TaxID=359407 RepID=UPI0003769EB9|nr:MULTISPECIES: RNA-binding S4 domain-containing protein [Methylotenera]
METSTFELKGEFIALCDLLKTTGIADSGGQGKAFVADGIVLVDGAIELRKTAKIRAGQTVECFDNKISVIAAT